jgi:hypothetical protein
VSKYDFFIAGRWRNRDEVMKVTNIVRSAGYKAHCFLENDYSEALAKLGFDKNAMESENTEKLPQDHALIQEIFNKDLEGQRASDNFLLVLPAGTASQIESGISYGMGKKCYAVGLVEKTETLYCIFDKIFADTTELQTWLESQKL